VYSELLPSQLHLGLPNDLFIWDFQSKFFTMLYRPVSNFLFSCYHPAYVIRLRWIVSITLSE
jgi:hypothetical protein